MIKRREFITLLGGAAAWPIRALAQQHGPMRRLGWLTSLAADDPQTLARVTPGMISLSSSSHFALKS